MKIEQIQLVLEIHREGSLSKAAQNLFMAQPNASKMLCALESELGYSIVDRTHNGVTFTERGLQFLQYANTVQRSVDSMKALKTETTGIRFSLAAYEYPFVERAFRRFCEHGLGTVDTLHCRLKMIGTIREGVDLLSSGAVDMAVLCCRKESYGQLEKMFRQRGLQETRLGSTALHVTLSKQHPMAGQEPLELADLASYPCITNAGVTKDFSTPKLVRLLQGVNMHVVMGPSQMRLSMLENARYFAISTPYTGVKLAEHGLISREIPNTERFLVALCRSEESENREICAYMELLRQECRLWEQEV